MKVSIIIPVFNVEKYLEECIESAINQTYSDIEIIAVNDGSTDRSLQILEKFSNKIKVISKKNGGKASAFNRGLKFASGEWIKVLDSDDVLLPTAIEDLIKETKKITNKNKVILYGNYDLIDSKGKIFDRVKEPNYNDLTDFELNVRLLDSHFGNEDTLLFHNSTLKDYGSYKEGIPFEDFEITLRYCLLFGCRLHHVNKTIAKYRMHPKQITRKRIKISLKESDDIRKSILDQLSDIEKEKYLHALKKYRNEKPFLKRLIFFIRYFILPKLPNYFSEKIINTYWAVQKHKNS